MSEELQNKRHSLSHLLAAAVLRIHPEAKPTIGPAVENGFYYDFSFKEPLSDKDLPKLEKEMRKQLSNWETFARIDVSADEARQIFQDNEYKLELIADIEKENQPVTLYYSGPKEHMPTKQDLLGAKSPNLKLGFLDLCRGGHAESPKAEISPDSFKLERVAGAYWRGDENNVMLSRIYGLAFDTKEELENYIALMEEAKKRDHKKLGKELDLFAYSDAVGKGLPLWTEKGATVRREIERFIIDEEIRRGYKHVNTPDIAKLELYEKSGHYPYYKESMYAPIEVDDEKFMLRPMTCPHHFELYLRKPHSYKELPVRIAELAQLYRYEQSGELSGLVRVRTFALADAHIICTNPRQAGDEINSALDLIEHIADTFGLKKGQDFSYRLSLGNRGEESKYYKDDAAWDQGENILRSVLQKRDVPFVEAEDEAAFYGPKIDIQMKNVLGKEETAFTVQYDFVMPKRFNLTYTDENGNDVEAVVVHRSSVGAIERIMAFLIEHFAGAFPVWLSPVQTIVLPIADRHAEYAKEVESLLQKEGVRVEIDARTESIGKKIREAEKQKIPYMLIVGDQEIESKQVSVRARGQKDLGSKDVTIFVSEVASKIASKTLGI